MKFVAYERAKQGTGASRRLRNTGKTPGIVYGGAGEPQPAPREAEFAATVGEEGLGNGRGVRHLVEKVEAASRS